MSCRSHYSRFNFYEIHFDIMDEHASLKKQQPKTEYWIRKWTGPKWNKP